MLKQPSILKRTHFVLGMKNVKSDFKVFLLPVLQNERMLSHMKNAIEDSSF